MGDDSSLSGTDSPPSAHPPATVDSTRAVQLSTAFTVLMALVLAGGMVGLSLALKATAVGLLVAIPCVVLNNVLRRRVAELLALYKVQHGA